MYFFAVIFSLVSYELHTEFSFRARSTYIPEWGSCHENATDISDALPLSVSDRLPAILQPLCGYVLRHPRSRSSWSSSSFVSVSLPGQHLSMPAPAFYGVIPAGPLPGLTHDIMPVLALPGLRPL